MSQLKRYILLSEARVLAIYAQRKAALLSLVAQFLKCNSTLKTKVKELEGRFRILSRNSSKSSFGDCIVNVSRACGAIAGLSSKVCIVVVGFSVEACGIMMDLFEAEIESTCLIIPGKEFLDPGSAC